MNLFKLAELQLLREGINNYTDKQLLNRAIKIRKWWDKHGTQASEIMAGDKLYHYGDKIRLYAKV